MAYEEQKKKMQRSVVGNGEAPPRYLPPEIFLENILTRLEAKDLARYSCVCKLWYDCTFKDSNFASHHFIQNKNKLNLVFSLSNVSQCAYIFTLGKDEFNDDTDDAEKFLTYKSLGYLSCKLPSELVGYCNGLVCAKVVSRASDGNGVVSIVHPIRAESLVLNYVTPPDRVARGLCNYLCHGFGFDSLSEEYKVVIMFTSTATTSNQQEFVCMVLTLGGSNSWRKIVTATSDIKPPPGCSSFPSSMVTTASRVTRKSATLCGGDLFWWITNSTGKNKSEMLLSFNIHSEKLHFVRLPTDQCSLTPLFTENDQQCSVVDHHLLEFKGYPCVASSETTMASNSGGCRHHLRSRSNKSSSNGCSVKVRLYLLKDKVEQVWMEEEMFDAQIKEIGVPPAIPPPTRMLSFSDQLLLYWFDGKCLVIYNLQMKHIKVVKCSNKWNRDIFKMKMKGNPPGYCPYMDYQLHAQPENIVSLKTFVREEETRKFLRFEDLTQAMEIEGIKPAGWVYMARESVKYFSFY